MLAAGAGSPVRTSAYRDSEALKNLKVPKGWVAALVGSAKIGRPSLPIVVPGTEFRDISKIHIVGLFPDYASAHAAWKAEAQRTVDDAHVRYFIAHLHRLRDEEQPASASPRAMDG